MVETQAADSINAPEVETTAAPLTVAQEVNNFHLTDVPLSGLSEYVNIPMYNDKMDLNPDRPDQIAIARDLMDHSLRNNLASDAESKPS